MINSSFVPKTQINIRFVLERRAVCSLIFDEMSDIYVGDPPPGQVRSLTDPPTRQSEMLAVGIATTCVAAVAVCLRFYTRLRIVRESITIDDYFVLISLVLTVTKVVLNNKQSEHGLGYHKWDILLDTFNIQYAVVRNIPLGAVRARLCIVTDNPFQYAIAGTCVYALSVGFAKVSILLFYLRLSPQRWFHIVVYTLIGAVSCYSTVYLLLNIFPCRPIAAAWDRNIEKKTCLDAWKAYWALSIFNILMDVATLMLPIPVIAPLNMPKKQKISVCLLFATGIFPDRTWDVAEDYILSYLETNVGIICASVPALRPLFLRFLPALVPSSLSSDRNTSKRQRQRSYGLSSVVEQNRQRRMMQQSSYELSSVDENLKQPSEDDEAKLWSPGRKENAVKVNAKTKDKDTENCSLKMLENLTPASVRGVNEITVSSGPSHLVQGGGIQVHHETVINYEGR
ncbi:hypothetical protein DL771_005881 [Monosporascus sp. 5C6A]|nr:hypothetical protein DL771_005881 [Monosporascus sp. 5C6A]